MGALFGDTEFDSSFLDVKTLLSVIGARLSTAVAIVLHEDGKKLKDKNIEEVADEIRFNCDYDDMVAIVEDFFVCNPIASTLEKVQKIIGGITEKVTEQI